MREILDPRRGLLRLLGVCAYMGLGFDPVLAQPAGRTKPPARPLPTIVIDPGHGGVDPGAISPNGAYEKDIVLAIAREFARQLAATRHFRVVLTRSTDEFIPVRARTARAPA